MKYFRLAFTLILIPFALFASNTDISTSQGTTQDVIVHLSPTVAQEDVLRDIKIEVTFSVLLDISAIKEHDVKLRHLSSKTNDSIKGSISYTQIDKKFTFTPHVSLEPGLYEVEIKSLKAQKGIKIKEIKYRFVVIDEINGHRLPPEPDSVINNSTLLGIDSNNNGVRDDVERAIYEKFPKEVRRQLLMQKARAHQAMLSDLDAINNAEKWQKIIANKPIACGSYLFRKFDIEFDIQATEYMEDKLYNNKDRLRKYIEYNHALGGGVYGVEENERVESACEFNVTKALKNDL